MTNWNRRNLIVAGGLFAAGCAGGAAKSGGPGASAGSGAAAGLSPALYYLGAAKVFALLPEGGAPVTLVDETGADGQRRGLNDGIALDLANGHVYWSDMGRASERDGSIHRCDIDGKNVKTIVPAGVTHTPKQLKIDLRARKLYWSDREGMAVMRANLDGSGSEMIVSTGNPEAQKGDESLWCVGIALDPDRGHFYWTQKGGDNAGRGMIRRANMKAPAGERADRRTDIRNLFTHLPEPIDLDLDLDARMIYWTDRGDETVSCAPMDVSGDYDPSKRIDRKILLRDLGEAIGVAIDPARNRMAWTNLEGDVGISAMDGSGKQVLASGQGLLTGISWAS